MKKNELYLISGSSGFVGRRISEILNKNGCDTVDLPRKLLNRPNKLREFVGDLRPKYIIHLAAYGNRYSQTDDLETIKTNLYKTINLLYASKDINYQAFINTGSSSEYGTKEKPMKETDSLDSDTFYGDTKAASTLICRAFAKKYKKPVVTVRPFSIYGRGDYPEKFIQTLIKCVKFDIPLDLASGVHDWIYIDDYISGVMAVVKNVSKLVGCAVNIGTGKQFTNEDIVRSVEKITGKKVKVNRVGALRSYDTKNTWVADNSLLRSLGWTQKYDILKGLASVLYAENIIVNTKRGQKKNS